MEEKKATREALFRVDDVVQLTCGGRNMLIEKLMGDPDYQAQILIFNGKYKCLWHNDAGDLNREIFREEQLQLVKKFLPNNS